MRMFSILALILGAEATGNGLKVTVEVQDNNDYTGPIFIGESFINEKVIYDTMISWTSVNVAGAQGATLKSNYDEKQSSTSEAIFREVWDSSTEEMIEHHLTHQMHFGNIQMSGLQMKDQMCLKQRRIEKERSMQLGGLCLKKHMFVAVEKIKGGEFSANGILGLAPSRDEKSFVRQLYDNGVIDKEVVSLNLEDPTDLSIDSTIGFGEIDGSQIIGGEDGLRYYSNVGQDRWALLMDHLQYGNSDIRDPDGPNMIHTKIALIDTGNSSIQIPETDFANLRELMIDQESSIQTKEIGPDRQRLVSDKKCSEIESKLSDFDFHIQATKITIHPKGYLFTVDNQCHIGIESIPDNINQIRLGTIFLRNFYTVLEFDKNLIMLGINSEGNGATRASIDGTVSNPFQGSGSRRGSKSKSSTDQASNTGTLYIAVLSTIVFILCGVIIKQKLDEKKKKTTYADLPDEEEVLDNEIDEQRMEAKLIQKTENQSIN